MSLLQHINVTSHIVDSEMISTWENDSDNEYSISPQTSGDEDGK